MTQIILPLLGFLLGGSFLGFIEFLIHRHDDKKDKLGQLMKRIDDLEKKMEDRFNILDEDAKKDRAIQARVRLLRFGDELRTGVNHSKESFDQNNEDIDTYEDYCESHPKFKNNKTVATVEYTKRIYAERLEKNDFI